MGQVIVAGPIVGVLAGWLEGSIVGGVGAAVLGGLTGALIGLGISNEQALKYEFDIKAGKFMVLVAGTNEQVDRAQQILQHAGYEIQASVAI